MRDPVRFYQQGLRRSKSLLWLAASLLLPACTKPRTDPPVAAVPVAIAPPAGPFGWVEGTVTARGALPALHPHRVDGTLARQCGEETPDLSLTVGSGGALAFAVASIDDAAPSPMPADFSPALLDQKGCVYRPAIVATRAGAALKVRNSDPVLHNVRGMSPPDRTPLFNTMMPLENLTIEKKLPATAGVVELQCDVHPWMHAWVATFTHGLFAVTDAAGHFKIDGVPVGHHPLKLWHPRLGEKRVEVEVKANAGSTIEVGWEVSDTPSP
jgi:plastocyanin